MTKQIRSETITIKFRSITDADDEKIGEGFMINTCERSILFSLTKNSRGRQIRGIISGVHDKLPWIYSCIEHFYANYFSLLKL